MNAPAHSSAKAICAQRDGGTPRRRSRSDGSAGRAPTATSASWLTTRRL